MKPIYILNLFLLFYFNSYSQKPCPRIPTIKYTGKTYHTVQIEDQCWLKENLDVGIMIQGTQHQTNNGVIEKYCFNNDSANCTKYGGLYQWNEAMQYSTKEGVQGICPSGWHIPTDTEFTNLKTFVRGDGNSLKAVGQGSGAGVGTNTSGFSALLSGCRHGNGSFYISGYNTNLWISTEYSAWIAYSMYLNFFNEDIFQGSHHKIDGAYVRCIKN